MPRCHSGQAGRAAYAAWFEKAGDEALGAVQVNAAEPRLAVAAVRVDVQ